MGWGSPYVLVLGTLILLWGGVSAYVLVTRALFDYKHLAFHGARRVVDHWLAGANSPEQRDTILRRLPRKTLGGIASDAQVDQEIAAAAARILLERRRERLLDRASRHRNEAEKWGRVAAIRVFALASAPEARHLIRRALEDEDGEVVAATVSLLGDLRDPESTELLVHALARGLYPRSRVATHLDDRDVTELLLPLVDHADEELRYWVAMLLRPGADPRVELAVASLLGDPSPQVRAAVAKAYARAGGAAAQAIGLTLLADPVWFVRAQAARTLAASGDDELAYELAPLLRDDQWWVRTAAKDALRAWGGELAPVLVPLLNDPDRFARNGAAEVLFETGVVRRWAERKDERAARLLTRALEAGEEPVVAAFKRMRA